MNPLRHDSTSTFKCTVSLSAAWRLFAGFLALAALAGPATGADITVAPPVGGNFIVTTPSGSANLLRINTDGSVEMNGLTFSSMPTQTQPVCMSAVGKLGPCATGGSSSIYVKKVDFSVNIDFPIQTYTAECDSPTDKVIGGVAYILGGNVAIRAIEYQDHYLQVVVATSTVDTLKTTITCLKAQ